MRSYSSRDVIQALKADGWYLVNTVGSHHQFKHPQKPGRVTVKHRIRIFPARPWIASSGSQVSGSGDLAPS